MGDVRRDVDERLSDEARRWLRAGTALGGSGRDRAEVAGDEGERILGLDVADDGERGVVGRKPGVVERDDARAVDAGDGLGRSSA